MSRNACARVYLYIYIWITYYIHLSGKDVPRAWKCHMWVKDSFLRRCVLEMHYFHVLWVCSCKAIWELRTSPLLYSVKTLMVATATLPSARRHSPQIALLKTALVKTARSPCERHAGVSSFGLRYSEVFEWIKGCSLRMRSCARAHIINTEGLTLRCGPTRVPGCKLRFHVSIKLFDIGIVFNINRRPVHRHA